MTRRRPRAAVEEAARHFETFNLDLMYALPSQTLPDLQRDLDMALAVRRRTCRCIT
jgi:coproporphyrinogen III oxidase-like Fe-S oxidoreductase